MRTHVFEKCVKKTEQEKYFLSKNALFYDSKTDVIRREGSRREMLSTLLKN